MKRVRNGSVKCLLAVTVLLLEAHAPAMERWAALAELESNNNDNALGSAGEISRYQMKPDIWQHYAATNANWRNASDALAVAKHIMQDRVAEFQRSFGRPPTDYEFYILWNAPGQIRHPGKGVRERAERFCNLVAAPPSRAESIPRS